MEKKTTESKPMFNWTGNPWVDAGLAVVTIRANKRTPEELSLKDFKSVVGDGKWLTHANEHLNSYVCLFANGFLNRSMPAQKHVVLNLWLVNNTKSGDCEIHDGGL